MPRLNYQGPLFILTAAALWGTTGTTQALAPESATPLAIGAMRLIVGGVSLLLLAIYRKKLKLNRHWSKPAFLLAALGMAGYQPLFFSGVALTGVAVGTLIAIGSAPVVAGLLGFIIHKEKPATKWYVSTILALAGCALLFTNSNNLQVNTTGMFLAMGAGFAYATYVMTSKVLLQKHNPDAVTAVIFCLAALLLTPILITQPLQWIFNPHGIMVSLHLGLVTVAIAYSIFARGLTMVPAATAVTLTLMEPLTAATLGITLLKEQLTLPTMVGMILLLAGLLILSLRQPPRGAIGSEKTTETIR